jgi:hypothetical protein
MYDALRPISRPADASPGRRTMRKTQATTIAMDERSGSREVRLHQQLEAHNAHNPTMSGDASHSTVTSSGYRIGVARARRRTPMIRKPLPYDLTPEDRLTRAKWVRGVGIFYGCAALLLFGFLASQRILA